MIKAKVSTDYKDIERIFAGGAVQKEILKVWSTEADAYVFEAWKILEIEGPLPITLKANGEPLIDYRIYGNTEQTGTPTPENPIMPTGCGERTDNFWDFQPSTERYGVTLTWNGAKIVFSGICTSSSNLIKPITLSAGTYTIKANANRIPSKDNNSCVDIYKASPFIMAIITNRNAINGIANFTLEKETTVTLRIRVQEDVNYDGFTLEPMLNLGSTALPYEPYGYKLPILSNSAVTNLYLGEVETTRRIKKLVLTGDEIWFQSYVFRGSCFAYLKDIASDAKAISSIVCTHVDRQSGQYHYGQGRIDENSLSLWLFGSSVSVQTFKSYLAAQYAAGTPVTVWYVLAEPETGVVNEPLMKIGDYSDTIDSTQANVQIPTSKGTTVIDYEGEDRFITSDGYELVDKNQNGFLLSGSTLRPSKMYIKYKGR